MIRLTFHFFPLQIASSSAYLRKLPVTLPFRYPPSHLWPFLQIGVNRQFDADNSQVIEAPELTNAFNQFGYGLSSSLIQLVLCKYGKPHLPIFTPHFLFSREERSGGVATK